MISGACNTTGSNSVVWLPARAIDNGRSIVLYPLHGMVAVVSVDDVTKAGARVLVTLQATLPNEKQNDTIPMVNGISWVDIPGVCTEIYCCCDDGSIFMWRRAADAAIDMWMPIGRLPSSSLNVTSNERNTQKLAQAPASACTSTAITITSLLTNEDVIVASSNSAGVVSIWRRYCTESFFSLNRMQIISFARASTPHALQLMHFGSADVVANDNNPATALGTLLLAGSVDARLHICVADSNGLFTMVGTLPGHEEWITCIATTHLSSTTPTLSSPAVITHLVATGSKDSKIRIWRFKATRTAQAAALNMIASNIINASTVDDGEDGEDIDPTETEGDETAVKAIVDDDDLIGAHEARLTFPLPSYLAQSHSLEKDNKLNMEWTCSVYLETLLVGHEDWVSSLVWLPTLQSAISTDTDATSHEKSVVRLFSTSMDRNMILWSSDNASLHHQSTALNTTDKSLQSYASGVWFPSCRIGDVGGMLGGSVGGNLLGFTASCMSADGRAILGIGYGGSFHLYCCADNAQLNATESVSSQNVTLTTSNPLTAMHKTQRWLSKPFLTGHFAAVTDLCWSADGSYVITVSSDQSARMWTRINQQKTSFDSSKYSHRNAENSNNVVPETNSESAYAGLYCEVSRPQIHGYNLTCVALAPVDNSNDSNMSTDVSADHCYYMYSAGDEKMVRIFDAPTVVLDGLAQLTSKTSSEHKSIDSSSSTRTFSAYIPELGLSNKAAIHMTNQEQADLQARGTGELNWSQGIPPLEGQLADRTVWPEIKKLYGHFNDIVCMSLCTAPSYAADGTGKYISGRYLATACKARNAETAAVLLWDTQLMSCVGSLMGHDSTISCLSFSACGTFLASSGKDRSLCLYMKQSSFTRTAHDSSNENNTPYALYTIQKGAHKRIVWDLTWTKIDLPGSQTQQLLLLTASRDGTCKLWTVQAGLSPSEREGKSLCCVHSFEPFGGVSVTAVQFNPNPHFTTHNKNEEHKEVLRIQLVVGSELGDLHIWNIDHTQTAALEHVWSSSHSTTIPYHIAHGAAVRRIRFAPMVKKTFESVENGNKPFDAIGTEQPIQLMATCGNDHTLRIFRL